jgi:hypothetical protein
MDLFLFLSLLSKLTKKNIKEKINNKKDTYLPHLVAICQICVRRFEFIFSSAPLPRCHRPVRQRKRECLTGLRSGPLPIFGPGA